MVEACSRALPGHVLLPGNPFLVAPKLLAEEGEGNLLLCQEAYYRGLNNNYLYYLGGSLYKFIASLAPKPYSSYSGRYISGFGGFSDLLFFCDSGVSRLGFRRGGCGSGVVAVNRGVEVCGLGPFRV